MGLLDDVWKALSHEIVKLLNDSTNAVRNWIVNMINTIQNTALSPIQHALGDITSIPTFVETKFSSVVSDTTQGAGQVINNALHTVTDPITTALGTITDVPS